MNGGAIGLYFTNSDSTVYNLVFENTLFEHLHFSNDKYGGGAISCSGNYQETRYIDLTANGCTFNNVSSLLGGGAIYFNSIGRELIVKNCEFKSTYTKNSGQKGGAIFAQFYYQDKNDHTMPISITNCTFSKAHSDQGGSIFIERDVRCTSSSNVIVSECKFYNSNADTNGHSIVVDQSKIEPISIDHCLFVDCGSKSTTYSIILNANTLNFINNEISFSNEKESCGCVELKKIGEHVFKGNLFKNAHNTNSIWNSAGINAGIDTNLTSLLIENNTFDCICGENQGRCFYIVSKGTNNVQVLNNTIKNCPAGGTLLKIWFQDQKDSFKIESCNFINNSVTDCYESIGPTPHFWFENIFNGDHINPIEVTIENCYFIGGSNTILGGGLSYGKNKYTANTKLILIGCHFLDNYAEQGGGALNIQIFQSCEIKNCEFKRNKSKDGCGSIFIETDFECLKNEDQNDFLPLPNSRNPTISIINCNFEDNTGKDSHAINIQNSNNVPIDLLHSNFMNCGTSGFVVSIQANTQNNNIQNCTFDYTTAQTSGGIYTVHDKLKLEGNTFSNFKETVIRFPCGNLIKNFN